MTGNQPQNQITVQNSLVSDRDLCQFFREAFALGRFRPHLEDAHLVNLDFEVLYSGIKKLFNDHPGIDDLTIGEMMDAMRNRES